MKSLILRPVKSAVVAAVLACSLPLAAPPAAALSLASSEEVERAAQQQYADLKRQAAAQGALAPPEYPPLQRVRRISERIIAQASRHNPRAAQWQWEVNLIGSQQVNAFAMPGGKIAVFTGLLDKLRLTDDELAAVIGHEVAHALLEHGRERVGKTRTAQLVTMGASLFSQVLGYGNLGGMVADTGSQLLLLKYGRADESEADTVGLEMAARAGFDPRAALVLWQKMDALNSSRQAPPQWLSTHPSNEARSREIRAKLPEVMPLYAQARGTSVDALPPYASSASARPSPRAATSGRPEDEAMASRPSPRGMQ